MNRYSFFFLLLLAGIVTYAQTSPKKPKKYPSLLWEIKGNGLTKPSYLFGTMHVSNKLAFHLSDSFYLGIRNADIVALETNPETWQHDLSRYDDMESGFRNTYSASQYQRMPQDYLRQSSLQVFKYEKSIEQALSGRPVVINNLLYRSNAEENSDFEEDTYLDLHIFQTGKRWGKKICSVENFDESMRLATEAYVDGMMDEKKKTNFEYNAEYSPDKLETAYRTGNLDLLDTITQINQQSAAFNEKFLYKRNENQAASIDSILKTKKTLFVGVGAAHLPGQRGVIEMLRKMGYQLRPVKMGERNSRFKDEVDKIRVPVQMKKQVAKDGFFKVDMPGTLFPNDAPFGAQQFQYADMANGSYYMITRIPTNAALWGANDEDVTRQVDSLLYENIPGKILSKNSVIKNGYKGFDIVNRTRRGDYQRSAVYITPFEVLIFKVSGNGEYVKLAPEANRFFSSIELKEYTANYKSFTPGFGGFEAIFPHEPFVIEDHRALTYAATDKKNGNTYQIQRLSIHNYEFVEEDSMDLNLLDESFSSSGFIEETVSRNHSIENGYPVLNATYKHKDGSISKARYLLKGPQYYALITHGKKEEQMQQFLNSFTIKPFVYKESQLQTDTNLLFSVSSPVLLEKKKENAPALDFKELYKNMYKNGDQDLVDNGVYKEKLILADSTGERIYVTTYNSPAYYFEADSSKWMSTDLNTMREGWMVRSQKLSMLPEGMRVNEYVLSDTNSSRALWCKQFIKGGSWYWIATETDTAANQSPFLTQFFQTFRPADTIKSINPFERKSAVFFNDFFSADSMRHKKAVVNVGALSFQSSDMAQLKNAINSLGWKEKQYLNTKKEFIWQLGTLPDKAVTDYLKHLYTAVGDTLDLQHAVLNSMLRQRTAYAYQSFKDIILNEPPVLEVPATQYNDYGRNSNRSRYDTYTTVSSYEDRLGNNFMDNLKDSLQLTATIFKDLLPLINIDDYEKPMMNLMEELVDSNYLKAKDYEIYFTKFLMEAKQAWKKQSISEKNLSIEEAQLQEEDVLNKSKQQNNFGNNKLTADTKLLIPFWNIHESVPVFIRQLLTSNDQELKYQTMLLLLQKDKPVADTLLDYFASLDYYRYDLYLDLQKLNKSKQFPKAYTSLEMLAKAKLLVSDEYRNIDTVQLLEKRAIEHKKKRGYVLFYKYKENEDDVSWKIATVGMVPLTGNAVEIYDEGSASSIDYEYDFTQLTDTRIEEDQPLDKQLSKVLKQMLYSKRRSAAEFYEAGDEYERMLYRDRY
jgi:uncharacterized protein YbaP (TraB family)